MKKRFKRICVLFSVLCLVIVSILQTAAETTYEYYDLKFTIINNFSVSIAGCNENVTEVTIPAEINGRKVVGVKNWAFMNNAGITKVDFSKASNLEYIGMFAFSGCTGLNGGLVIPNSVKNMDVCAFEDCSGIESVTFGNGITSIPNQCFRNCTSLSSITLHKDIQSIGNYAFANCPGLTYLQLDRNVTSIANSAFSDNPNLTLGVWFDSAAHNHAVNNHVNFKLLDAFMLGDVNMDGSVNINDVTSVQRNLAELEAFNDLQKLAADANQDSIVDISDATTLQMYLAEYDIPNPIGEIITQ